MRLRAICSNCPAMGRMSSMLSTGQVMDEIGDEADICLGRVVANLQGPSAGRALTRDDGWCRLCSIGVLGVLCFQKIFSPQRHM